METTFSLGVRQSGRSRAPSRKIGGGGDNILLVDDPPVRLASKKTNDVIPLILWILIVLALAATFLFGVRSHSKVTKQAAKNNASDVSEENKQDAEPVLPPAERQREKEPPKRERTGAKGAFSHETDEESSSDARESRTDRSDRNRRSEFQEKKQPENDFDEWLEEQRSGAGAPESEPFKFSAFRDGEQHSEYDERDSDSEYEDQNVGYDGQKPVYEEQNFRNRAPQRYSASPFNDRISDVPTDWLGHDLSQVAKSLERYEFRLPSSRSDDKVFQRHAELIREEPLYGSLQFGSRLAYVMKNESEGSGVDETIKVDYQESTRTMTARRSFKLSHIPSSVVESSKNSFSVYFTLFAKQNKSYGLRFRYEGEKASKRPQFESWTLTGVSPDDYLRLKDTLRVLCTFELGVYGDNYSGLYTPSRYDSYPISNDFRYPLSALCAEDPEFWLYDGATGEILAKYTKDEFFNGRRRALRRLRRRGDVSDSDSDSSAPKQKLSWNDVLKTAVEPEATWKTKKPSITIPDDAPSLEDALAMSHDGDVIAIRAGATPVPIRSKAVSYGESSDIICDREVVVVGETGESGTATIQIPKNESLTINLPGYVTFKGVTFITEPSKPGEKTTASVVVKGRTTARFQDCRFVGAGLPESSGVSVLGEHAAAEFWRCQFSKYEVSALLVDDSASATLDYCQFVEGNRRGISALGGASVKVDRCRFDGNVTGFIAEAGGKVVVSNSFFSKNRSNWSVSAGSARLCDVKEGNVIED